MSVGLHQATTASGLPGNGPSCDSNGSLWHPTAQRVSYAGPPPHSGTEAWQSSHTPPPLGGVSAIHWSNFHVSHAGPLPPVSRYRFMAVTPWPPVAAFSIAVPRYCCHTRVQVHGFTSPPPPPHAGEIYWSICQISIASYSLHEFNALGAEVLQEHCRRIVSFPLHSMCLWHMSLCTEHTVLPTARQSDWQQSSTFLTPSGNGPLCFVTGIGSQPMVRFVFRWI